MNNTILDHGNGIRQVCLTSEDLIFLDGCVLHIKDRTLFEKDKRDAPMIILFGDNLYFHQYYNPMHLDELGIDEIGDLKLEIEEKYPEKSESILSQLNINP